LKAELPWSLLGVAWLAADTALSVRAQLQSLMAQFAFASCTPFSNNLPAGATQRERSGVLFRAAGHDAPPDELLQKIEALLGLSGPDILRYADKKRGQRRAVRLVNAGQRAKPGWTAFCWPATHPPKAGSKPCCRTNWPRTPMAAPC
jgi:assimilatory nitrate reductase catalytic subunit